ncbi:hypothetical protein BH10PSE4_BH10PSE4_16510 [soil metagenome]
MDVDATTLGAIAAGLAVAPLLTGLSMGLTLRRRRGVYTRAKRDPVAPDFDLPSIPPGARTAEEQTLAGALYQLLQAEHNAAKALQDQTVAYLVAASVTLLAAFVASILGVTALKHVETFHLFAAGLDMAALAAVLWAFLRSGQYRARWIRQRVLTELLRQWAALDFVLIPDAKSFTVRYDAFRKRAADALQAEYDPLEAAVVFGTERVREIRAAIQGQTALPVDAVRYYLNRRPFRQAHWFATSAARLEGAHDRRQGLMLTLYVIAALAAVVKLVGLLVSSHATADWATLFLLVSVGLAGASTSTYFSQNQRSLRHRYEAHLRALEDWFDAHAEVWSDIRQTSPLGGPAAIRFAHAVASFESMMVIELIDWIAVTTDDVMEIAPG